jgi:hypothetical protein
MAQAIDRSLIDRPLGAGELVSAATRLYIVNFKEFIRLSLVGYLWSLVPVYGWARCGAKIAQLTRIAYNQVSGRIEEPQAVEAAVEAQRWGFVGVVLLLILIYLGGYGAVALLCLPIVLLFLLLGFAVGFGAASSGVDLSNGSFFSVLGVVAALVAVLVGLAFFSWLLTRTVLSDMPMAVEAGMGVRRTITRAWQITKGSVWRLQLVFLVAFLVSLPLVLLDTGLNLATDLLLGVDPTGNTTPTLQQLLVRIPERIFVFLFGYTVSTPYWQALKAVVYADLRIRREGGDLKLKSAAQS